MSNTNSEREFDFALVLSDEVELSDELEQALYGGACDDCTISSRSGRVYLHFTRSGPSIKAAILSAIVDFRSAKVVGTILRIDESNLVTQAEIARKIGRSRQLIHQYIRGERGPGGFPPPVCDIVDGASLYYWCEVAQWLWENDMITESVLRDAQEVAVINSVLELQHHKQHHSGLANEVTRLVGKG